MRENPSGLEGLFCAWQVFLAEEQDTALSGDDVDKAREGSAGGSLLAH